MDEVENIIVISQNVKLESLSKLKEYITPNTETLIISTQLIFENEAELIDSILECRCEYLNFSDLMTDVEFEACDVEAYNPAQQLDYVWGYYDDIRRLKNKRIIQKVNAKYQARNKIIVCDDLGLFKEEWINNGFQYVECDYYHKQVKSTPYVEPRWRTILLLPKRKIYNPIRNRIKEIIAFLHNDLSVAYDGHQKYHFWGSLNRIGYRLDLQFESASKWEHFRTLVDCWINTQPQTINLSTLHEWKGFLPDRKNLNLKLIQDGYLPPNYSSKYLKFYGKYTEFYCWDKIGQKTFIYHHLPNRIIPFRHKLYLPNPSFPATIKKVLCVASGAGDWTAIKNRSDEDKMIHVFGRIAALFPDIQFIYRCHPVWIHPLHQGVNSINRAAEYITYLNLPNFSISSNIPCANSDGKFVLSFKRSSFEEDLKDVDIVFGEHSISMIDAALKGILFASVNVTGHRDFFESITQLGFPHCESEEEIAHLIQNIHSQSFRDGYLRSIDNYNKMTDEE